MSASTVADLRDRYSIDVCRVQGVLLADGWYTVADQSFDVKPYRFVFYTRNHDRRRRQNPMIRHEPPSEPGYVFRTPEGKVMVGPLSAIYGLRVAEDR